MVLVLEQEPMPLPGSENWGLVLDPELDGVAGCVTGEETRDQSLVSLQIQDHIIPPSLSCHLHCIGVTRLDYECLFVSAVGSSGGDHTDHATQSDFTPHNWCHQPPLCK